MRRRPLHQALSMPGLSNRYLGSVSLCRLSTRVTPGRGLTRILLGRLRRKLRVACLGQAQVFLGLRKVGAKAQRLFELRDCLGSVAFAHENLSQLAMRLVELRVEPGRLQVMRLCLL